MRVFFLSAASLLVLGFVQEQALALQAAPADTYLSPVGSGSPSATMQPYQLATRDQNGNRIIINGKPVSAGGTTLSATSGNTFGFGGMRRASQGSTLSQATLSAVSIGNSVSINNVRNSTIVITQRNSGEVRAQLNANAVPNTSTEPEQN